MKYIDVAAALKALPPAPTWTALVTALADVADWTADQAEGRLLAAIADGVVLAILDDDNQWCITTASPWGGGDTSSCGPRRPTSQVEKESQ